MNPLQQIYLALKNVFKERKYFLIFLITAVIFFALFIIIPVFTIPGNDLAFQLSIFRKQDYFLMTFLALLVGLNLAFQVYIFKQQRTQNTAQSVAGGAISGVSGIFGAIVGTAACASCLALLFGLIGLGTGSVFFVLKNQSYFLLGAVVLMVISIYFSSRKINKVCTSC